jgi:hypothetical protein
VFGTLVHRKAGHSKLVIDKLIHGKLVLQKADHAENWSTKVKKSRPHGNTSNDYNMVTKEGNYIVSVKWKILVVSFSMCFCHGVRLNC